MENCSDHMNEDFFFESGPERSEPSSVELQMGSVLNNYSE